MVVSRLFTLFTMATQHRERGVHEKAEDTQKDFDFITKWESCWERQHLPREIPRLGLNLEPVSDMVYKAKKIHDKHGMVIISMVNWKDLTQVKFPNSQHNNILLDQTLYIAQSSDLLLNLQHLPHTVLEPLRSSLQNQSCAEHNEELELLQMIISLTQQQLQVLTLPTTCKAGSPPALPWPLPPSRAVPRVAAGRCPGQTSPMHSFMLWDGRKEQVFRLAIAVLDYARAHRLVSFKLAWLEQVQAGNMVQWDWLAQAASTSFV